MWHCNIALSSDSSSPALYHQTVPLCHCLAVECWARKPRTWIRILVARSSYCENELLTLAIFSGLTSVTGSQKHSQFHCSKGHLKTAFLQTIYLGYVLK